MNKSFRPFFLSTIIVMSAVLTGCAGTGGIQGNANFPVSINGRLGNVSVGGQGSNVGGQVVAQQPVHYQQQNHPGCQGGARPYFLGDGRPACMVQPQQQYQPQQHQHSQYQQQRQCGMWAGDCNQQYQTPIIPAAPCRIVNVPVQWDQYGRPVAYQQRRQC